MWSPPEDWTSAGLPVVYRSFDSDKYLQLENGAQVVAGKVGFPENFVRMAKLAQTFSGIAQGGHSRDYPYFRGWKALLVTVSSNLQGQHHLEQLVG